MISGHDPPRIEAVAGHTLACPENCHPRRKPANPLVCARQRPPQFPLRPYRSERGLAPVSKDAYDGPFSQHQLARIYMLVGEPERALDRLEPLLKIPCPLSGGWGHKRRHLSADGQQLRDPVGSPSTSTPPL